MMGRGVLSTIGWLLRVVILLGILLTATIFLLILAGESGSPPLDNKADCALVFGSAVYGWNTPGPAMQRRVRTAVRLYNEGNVKHLVFTGGRTTSTDQAEAQVMRQEALEFGVPSSVMQLETRAQSTWQNLKFSKPLLKDCASVVGVSDGFHLARIRFTARLQGWGMLPTIPTDDSPTSAQHFRSVLREFLAMIYYAGMGPWLDDMADPA